MDTKEKITQCAFIMFLEKGYNSTTYTELIKATNVSKGAFYHYFKNKEELFYEVIDKYFLSFFNQVQWSDYEKSSLTDLEQIIREFYLSFILRIRELSDKGLSRYFILFFEAVEFYPSFREEARRFYRRFKQLIENKSVSTGKDISAIDLISRYEGYLFWLALFPTEKLENLI